MAKLANAKRYRAEKAARDKRKKLMLLAAAAAVASVAALIIVGSVLRGGGETQVAETLAQREGRVLGLPAAPVVVTAWEDFQCPVCKAANQSVLASLIKDYVETGKVQFHYRNFAFLGEESVWAAQAAECSAEQGKFWEYHDILFSRQSGENRGAFTKDRLKGFAGEAGLDTGAFATCLDSGRYKAAVEAERKEGQGLGVSGTPTLFVEGQKVQDWRSYDALRKMIDAALGGTP